jgi:hypothetical protein
MDKKACAASGFEHGTVAGVLWQKGALPFAAWSQANSGPVRVGKEPYFHLRSIASSKTRGVPHGLGQSIGVRHRLARHRSRQIDIAICDHCRTKAGHIFRPGPDAVRTLAAGLSSALA